MNALKNFILRAVPLTLTSLTLLSPQTLRAQSGTNPQFLFAAQNMAQGGMVTTYGVDQTTGALAVPAGVNPAPVRIAQPSFTNQAAVVNPAGTFLFIAGTNTSNDSAVSVLSISANGALSELAASPFSAADASFPTALAISPDGQYLYELSGNSLANPNNSILDVYSIAADGTLTPVGNCTLPNATKILFMHPTGQWLYAYGDASPGVPTIQELAIGPPGVLTNTGSFALQDKSQADGLVGDAAGKYLFSLRNQIPGGGVNLVDTFSVDGNGGGLTLLNTYSPATLVPPPPGSIVNANEAIDSTGGFLYTSFANFSLGNGIPTLLQINATAPDGPLLLLASRTSPFLFSAGTIAPNMIIVASDVIGSGGTLTAAPGSPYAVNTYYALAVTGSVPVPTEPVLTLSTTSISFPATAAGQTAMSTVTLSSTGFSPLTFDSISLSGDASYSQTDNCPNSLATGSNCTVTVKFAPTAPGTFTGALNIASNAPSASVSLSGTAPSVADPDLTPMTLTFPSTVVGVSSATQSFTIENLPDATASLQITGITIGGSNPNDFSQTNNCTAALNAGQSCTIVITFTPLAVGGRSATVTATTSNPNNGRLGGTMNGVGASGTQQFQLQTSIVGPGTIQQSPLGTSFNANTSITLTAVANANATFTNWSGACAGSTNTVCTFSINANTAVTATFTANPSVGVTQGQQTGAAGTTFTFPINVTGFATQPTLTASCSIPAGTCTISGTNLVVTTTPRSSGIMIPEIPRFPAMPTLVLGLLLLLFASSRSRRVVRRLALVGGFAVLTACQTGGGGGGSTPSGGTPAGTYTVTVHATAGTQASATTVTVVVQ